MHPLREDDPRQVGPFVLTARLGSGAMGAVFLAHSVGGRAVAVKVVHPGLAADPGFRARFGREVAAARRVGGFWTAAVVDADPDAVTPWLASAYIPGPNVQEAVWETGPLPEPTLRGLAAGLAEALVAVHAAGLVHRDVKPSNILLSSDGPRLVDFGIARAFDQTGLTAVGTVAATPAYASPEQITGGTVGPASDVFSLAAVLVYAATGAGPYGPADATGVLHRAALGRVDVGATPAALRPLVTACLADDPRARPRPVAIIEAVRVLGGAPDAAVWVPPPVRTMIDARAAAPAASAAGHRPLSRAYTAAVGHARSAGAPPASMSVSSPPASAHPPDSESGLGAGVAVFTRPKRWAFLRLGWCLFGLLVAPGVGAASGDQPWVGGLLSLFCLVTGVITLTGLLSLPSRVEIGPGGVGVTRGRAQFVVSWGDVVRIGVSQTGRRSWLVAWRTHEAVLRDPGRGFAVHHGGACLYRVAPWRGKAARLAEVREIRAALGWHARERFDPQL